MYKPVYLVATLVNIAGCIVIDSQHRYQSIAGAIGLNMIKFILFIHLFLFYLV